MKRGIAVLILVALSVAVHAGDVKQDAAAPTGTTDAAETARKTMMRGLDWLKGIQKENGSWSDENYPAMTALGLWAFARSDHPDKAAVCAKAAGFVAGFAQKDGGIYKPASGGRGSGGLSVYNTAICMTALHCLDRDTYAPLILKAREFMAGSQIVGDSPGAGGFGYENTVPPLDVSATAARKKAAMDGKPPPTDAEIARMAQQRRADLSNSGWAMMAMRLTQDVEKRRSAESKPVDLQWAQAVDFLKKLQDLDEKDARNCGGFGYEQSGERGGTTVSEKDGKVKLRGFGSMTYAGLESLIYAQVDKNDVRVRSALQWAARHWSVGENPGMGSRGLYYYYNVMSKALSASGTDVLQPPAGGEPIPWKKQIVEKLAATQRADGSWVNTNNQFWENDAMLVTAYCVLTLEYATGK